MANLFKLYISDKFKAALVIVLLLFGALALSGGPDENTISIDAAIAQAVPGGTGPYHTIEAF